MRSKRLFSIFWACVLGFLGAYAGIFCLISGFRLQIPEVAWVTGSCVAAAVVFSICSAHSVGWFPGGILAILGGFLWRGGALEASVEGLVFQVTSLYDTGYGWGAVRWTDGDPAGADLTLALCAIGILVAAVIAWVVCRRRSAWLGVTITVLPAAACLVLTNTVPDPLYIYLLLTVLVVLLLTQSQRRRDEEQGNTLTAMVAVPVALAVALLFLLIPQQGYDGQKGAERIEEVVMQLLGLEDNTPQVSGPVGNVTGQTVSLAQVGPKTYHSSKVMTVTSQRGGQMYLRGCAYDVYDGVTWSASKGEWTFEQEYISNGQAWEVDITTMQPHDVLYMPHVAPELVNRLRSGKVVNAKDQVRYGLLCTAPAQYEQSWETLGGSVSTATAAQYLQLPEQTARQARKIVSDALGSDDPGQTAGEIWRYAQKVARLVGSSARYDLQTRRMPSEEQDFALWFLQESDTGYCVHFATATTVLLRSVGIPARYVTGYLVDAQAGKATMVRLRDAHAWVEVYLSGVGWVTLEATPAGFGSPVPETTQDPEQTTAPSQDTQPDETTGQTQPAQTTEPEQTAGDTEPMIEPIFSLPTATVGIGGADAPEEDPPQSGGKALLLWLLGLVAVAALTVAQWQLRLYLRHKKHRAGTANAQALALWQEVCRHARVRKLTPDEALEALAQKARFSQHTITRQELRQLEGWLAGSRRELRRSPVWKQVYYTLILALY